MKTVSTSSKKFKIRDYRFYIQLAFAMLCIWIGVEFYLFISFLESGGTAAFFSRPPGVDGFLPISSLMSFYLFLMTGEISIVHPAGFFIFSAIVVISLLFGKSFCSWFCPVGFLSELLGDLGEKIFRRKLKLPKFLDYPLRSLKYLLLGFFVYSIFFLMTDMAIKAFLEDTYNIMADVKMYYFFADISRFSLIVISVLFVLSIVIRNFWCRFLCPYGALLGIFSLISPNKIKRNTDSCIDCKLCTKACPSSINVHKIKTVISDECTSCMNCVDVCPVKDTLDLKNVVVKKTINRKWVAVGVVGIFMLITGIGIVTGYWQNNVSKEEYLFHHKNIDDLGHPTDSKSIKQMNEEVSK
ncbi:MAG: 4Fe-4S binding protein [Candidatus Kapaibacterium sp.]